MKSNRLSGSGRERVRPGVLACDADASPHIRDVWSLFAAGAVGESGAAGTVEAVGAATPTPSLTPAAVPEAAARAAPRDVVDDLFALVVALRGDGAGTMVIELDLDEQTLPGVTIRIAETGPRLCFTFFCRQAEGFRRLADHAATMAELLHERLARPVGIALRHVRDGAHADVEVDADVETG